MSKENSKRDRQSTRLSIAIPVIISGVDADGQNYSESVRTVIINKHGGKIATTRHLALGSEVLIENQARALRAKASVVWLGEKLSEGNLQHVALQLVEAQNIWGIIFPPDDWVAEQGEELRPVPLPAAPSADAKTAVTESPKPLLPPAEISNQVVRELQQAADNCARDFQDRLKQLTQQLGMEMEFELRACAFIARDREVGGMGEQLRILQESLNTTREEVGKLEARVRELRNGLQTKTKTAHSTTPEETQRQLAALSNSILESMNRAAEDGLREYRRLLQTESNESAAKLRGDEGIDAPATPNSSSEQ